ITEIYSLSLHDALPICSRGPWWDGGTLGSQGGERQPPRGRRRKSSLIQSSSQAPWTSCTIRRCLPRLGVSNGGLIFRNERRPRRRPCVRCVGATRRRWIERLGDPGPVLRRDLRDLLLPAHP